MSKKKTLTIIVTRAPYSSECAMLAPKIALEAKRKNYNVNLFLYGDGVWISHLVEEKEYSNPGEWIRRAIKRGVNVFACIQCSKARDLNEKNIISGVKLIKLYDFAKIIKESDKVISFSEG